MPSFFGWLARFFEAVFSSFVAGVATGAGLVLVVVPPFYFGDVDTQKWFMCAVIPILAIVSGVTHYVTVVSPLISLSRRLRHCCVVVREQTAEVDKAVKLGALPPLLEVSLPGQTMSIAPAARSFALSRSLFNSPQHVPSARGAGTISGAFRAYTPAHANPLALSVPASRANTPTPYSQGSSFTGTPTRLTSVLDSPGDRQVSAALSADTGAAPKPPGSDAVTVSVDMVNSVPLSTVNENCIRDRLHALQRCPRLMRQDDNTRANGSHRDVRQVQHAALELLKNLDAQNTAVVEQWSALVSWLSEQVNRLQQQNQMLNHQIQSLCAVTRHNSMFTIPEDESNASASRETGKYDGGGLSQHRDPNRPVAPLAGISQDSAPLVLHERTPTCPPSAFDCKSPSFSLGGSSGSSPPVLGDDDAPATYDDCAAREEQKIAEDTSLQSFDEDAGIETAGPPTIRNTKLPPKTAASGVQVLPKPVHSATRHMSLSTEGDINATTPVSPTQSQQAADLQRITLATPRPLTPTQGGWEPLGLDLQNSNITVRLHLNRGHRFPSDSHNVFFYVYRKYGSHSGRSAHHPLANGPSPLSTVHTKKNLAEKEKKCGPETLMEWLLAFECPQPLNGQRHPNTSAFEPTSPSNASLSSKASGSPKMEAPSPFQLFEWTPAMRGKRGMRKGGAEDTADGSPKLEPSVPEETQRKFGLAQCDPEEHAGAGATPAQAHLPVPGGFEATPTTPGTVVSFICSWAPLPKRPMRLCSLPVFLNGKERKYVPVLETIINKVFCVVDCAEIVAMDGFEDHLSPQTSTVSRNVFPQTPLSAKPPGSPTATEALLLKGVCIEDDTGTGTRFGETVVELIPMPHLA